MAHKRRAERTTGCRIFWLANGLNKLKKDGMDVDDAVSPPVWPPNFLTGSSEMREILLKIAGGEEDVFSKEDVKSVLLPKNTFLVEVIRVKA